MKRHAFWRRVAAVFFPERCAFCNQPVAPFQGICTRCRETAERIRPPVCPCCGRSENQCSCRKKRRYVDRCVAAYYYTGVVREAILRLKNDWTPLTLEAFSGEMAEVVRREYGDMPFDGIVFAPMTDVDVKQRGYNQSGLLAARLSEELNIPVQDVLRKVVETKPQKTLTAFERRGNVFGAFDLRPGEEEKVADRFFLLVDDMMTTGATLDECAKVLKLYGAAVVFAVTLAASPGREESDNGAKATT